MRERFIKKLIASIFFLFAFQAQAGNILLTQFDFPFNGVDVYEQMKTNLEADGHTVDIVDAKTGGALATVLGTGSYDQLFLWDLTASSYLNAADLTAVGNFWNTDMGVVVNTRSYGYYFQGNDPSEVALLENVAEALDLSGGIIWIGPRTLILCLLNSVLTPSLAVSLTP